MSQLYNNGFAVLAIKNMKKGNYEKTLNFSRIVETSNFFVRYFEHDILLIIFSSLLFLQIDKHNARSKIEPGQHL
jgi:hypothetical protein